VLVAGGWNDDELDTVELFDPTTNTWSPGPAAQRGAQRPLGGDAQGRARPGRGRRRVRRVDLDAFLRQRDGGALRPRDGNVEGKTGRAQRRPRGERASRCSRMARVVMAGGFSQVRSFEVGTTEIFDPATGVWDGGGPAAPCPAPDTSPRCCRTARCSWRGGYGGRRGSSSASIRPGRRPPVPHAGRHGPARGDRGAHRHTGSPAPRAGVFEAREAPEVAHAHPGAGTFLGQGSAAARSERARTRSCSRPAGPSSRKTPLKLAKGKDADVQAQALQGLAAQGLTQGHEGHARADGARASR